MTAGFKLGCHQHVWIICREIEPMNRQDIFTPDHQIAESAHVKALPFKRVGIMAQGTSLRLPMKPFLSWWS